MDLLAALALVLVIEGLALAIFASSLRELRAAMEGVDPRTTRLFGLLFFASGIAAYIAIRG